MSDTVTVEHAILCTNGRIHYGDEHLRRDDRESIRRIADSQADEPWCGGGPHVIASRQRIVTGWRATP